MDLIDFNKLAATGEALIQSLAAAVTGQVIPAIEAAITERIVPAAQKALNAELTAALDAGNKSLGDFAAALDALKRETLDELDGWTITLNRPKVAK
jgi:hypothetical protein